MSTNSRITEKQELLLMRHFDGESSFLEKRRARALLRSNAAAEAFWIVLDDAARGAKMLEETISAEIGEIDLWDRIDQRIEQEERAEFFLGRRDVEKESVRRESFFDAFFAKGFASGFAGAAAAVFMAFMILPGAVQMAGTPVTSPVDTTPVALRDMNQAQGTVNLASSSSSNTNLFSAPPVPRFQGDDNYVEPRILDNRPVEVDWMRSDGRVRMVQDPSESAPIIWVKRVKPRKKVRIYRSRDGKRMLVVEKAIPSETLVPSR